MKGMGIPASTPGITHQSRLPSGEVIPQISISESTPEGWCAPAAIAIAPGAWSSGWRFWENPSWPR
jgi:hypothetical protein